jgi:hypothetical protein
MRLALALKADELKDNFHQADVPSRNYKSTLPEEKKEIGLSLPQKSKVDLYRIIPQLSGTNQQLQLFRINIGIDAFDLR